MNLYKYDNLQHNFSRLDELFSSTNTTLFVLNEPTDFFKTLHSFLLRPSQKFQLQQTGTQLKINCKKIAKYKKNISFEKYKQFRNALNVI